MKFPLWLRFVWWGILLAGATLFTVLRMSTHDIAFPTAVDTLIVLIGLLLLLFPLVSEITIAGVTLKKEVESLKADIKEQLASIRMDIHNSVGIQTQFNPNILIGAPADWQIPALRQEIQQTIRNELSTLSVPPPAPPEADVPLDTQYLFAVRYSLEREMNRLLGAQDVQRPVTGLQLARLLVSQGRISINLERSIREMYAVCSAAIHGRIVSPEQVSFARDLGPQLIAALRAIP